VKRLHLFDPCLFNRQTPGKITTIFQVVVIKF